MSAVAVAVALVAGACAGTDAAVSEAIDDVVAEAAEAPEARSTRTTIARSTTTASPTTTTPRATTTSTTTTVVPTTTRPQLLTVTDRKDGDSFVASDGNEYRLGLVNTPELNEQCGRAASDFTYAFLADGFSAHGYETDRYGRVVAEVFNPAGESLNVALAASGFGNDRYLAQYRHENPDLAARLEAAFARAQVPSCRSAAPTAPPTTSAPVAPAASASGCHPAYSPCVPIEGNGSGHGKANDLNCPEIGKRVQVLDPSDPYGLDRDGDGWGCESYG